MNIRFYQKIFIIFGIVSFINLHSNLALGMPLPEFSQTNSSQWINSDAITVNDLKGHVVLIDVWTFECWNCYRSFPWLRDLEHRYTRSGLKIIGIHSPEFAREKVIANIKQKVKQFNLHHPVMVDNDRVYWKALGNRYWPAFYVVDKKGIIRDVVVGETHIGDRNANRIELKIKALILE